MESRHISRPVASLRPVCTQLTMSMPTVIITLTLIHSIGFILLAGHMIYHLDYSHILLSYLEEEVKVLLQKGKVELSLISLCTLHFKSISPISFCFDIDAPRSCINWNSIDAYYRRIIVDSWHMCPAVDCFDLVTTQWNHLMLLNYHCILLIMSMLDLCFLIFLLVYVPAVFGLDIFDGYSLLADNVTNQMWHWVVTCKDPLEVHDVWSVLLVRTETHVYAEMEISSYIFYTTRQLEKLHRQLAHPSATKFCLLLKTARD